MVNTNLARHFISGESAKSKHGRVKDWNESLQPQPQEVGGTDKENSQGLALEARKSCHVSPRSREGLQSGGRVKALDRLTWTKVQAVWGSGNPGPEGVRGSGRAYLSRASWTTWEQGSKP